jgi:hypothetical protein
MQTNEITPEGLRRLAALKPAEGRVLSVYVNLDPSEFATPQARATQITSLLDEADRMIRREDGLSHSEEVALRADLEQLSDFLRNGGFSASGAHAMAVFCCGPAALFEALKLPRPVPGTVVIDDSPWVEPLVELGPSGSWAVLLVSRKVGRILRGSRDRLEEVERRRDDVHGQHDQGGWSQANYQRSVEKEVADHVKGVAEELFESFRRNPFERLLVGAPEELASHVEAALHPYVHERLAGRIHVDVETVSPEEVRVASQPLFEADEAKRERAALDRLAERLGAGGRAAAGLEDVLAALNERRVETLLLADGFTAAGVVCPADGWLGVGERRCPLDGTAVQQRDDIVESAVEAALAQSAEVLTVRHHDDLDRRRGIAALLRF